MIKAIIFDLDGTLLNTSRDIHSVLNGTLGRFNLPQVSLSETIEYVGNGAKKLVERAIPANYDVDFNEVFSDYLVNFASCNNSSTTLYEGEESALRTFCDMGLKLAVCTNKPQDATDNVCKKLLGQFGFSVILGGSERFPLKPDPSGSVYIAKKLGVNCDECLFVGDGETDVITAKNAGMHGVSVLWGYRTRNRLKDAGATTFSESYADLTSLVRSLT